MESLLPEITAHLLGPQADLIQPFNYNGIYLTQVPVLPLFQTLRDTYKSSASVGLPWCPSLLDGVTLKPSGHDSAVL